MEMRKVLLACAVLCSIASIACAGLFDKKKQVLKACNDSGRPIDDISEIQIFNGEYSKDTYRLYDTVEYQVVFIYKAPTEMGIDDMENLWDLNCDSGEIKGKARLVSVSRTKGTDNENTYSRTMIKGTTYKLTFRGEYDKTPKEGDNCVSKIYLSVSQEEESYCFTDKAVIIKEKN